ncbi:MAG: NAD-dependent dehydratase [Conexibacter sp.]|nr:NAD-dependent dehydratase [Conexibacter sp.]
MGGTGTLGRQLVRVLSGRGHEVRALSRSAPEWPVDVRTGTGLDAALADCDVVVDAANGPASAKAADVLVEGTRHVLAAARAAGVGHHVCVSIVGCERVPMGYYRVKVAQEQAVAEGDVPWTVVRATQFHDLLGGLFAQVGRAHVLPTGAARFQPIDVADAAGAIADAAEAGPRRGHLEVAGPEVLDLTALARTYRRLTGVHAVALPVPLPPRLGRALRAGALIADHPDHHGTRTFAQWLS